MVYRVRRITNGERAAICGLVIAGQPFIRTCRMLGVPYKAMLDLLPDDWRGRQLSPAWNKRWKGPLLKELEAAWCDFSIPTRTLVEIFKTSRDNLRRLARENDWPRRPIGGKKPLPVPVSKMEPDMAKRYRKLARVVGRTAAERAVFGGAR